MALRGVLAGVAVALLVALLGVAAATAAETTTNDTTTASTTTTDATTTEPSTTTTEATTTTSPAATTTTTSPAATTTTPVTTATTRTTTRPASTTTTAPASRLRARSAPTRKRAGARHLHTRRRPVRCRIEAAALLIPGRRPRVLATLAHAPRHGARLSVGHAHCVAGGARLRSVSLLGGSVAVARVVLAVGKTRSASATGLVVAGRRVASVAHGRIALGRWAYVVAARRSAVHVPGGRTAVAGLVVHLLKRHAGLPAGTTLAVAVTGLQLNRRVPRSHRPHVRMGDRPLRVTPPLGERRYVFPVAGHVDYGDSYGGFRGDVPGNWHHGDDLFAPLGTPVVALAGGRIYRVGWERLGGWRLWLRDRAGNEFYYAHLSGYALARLHAQRVRAGQVLGYVGNTGDAFTTPPHLHFEIHPHRLLRLGYNGAVDPTTYIDGWAHLRHVHARRPVHPPLPRDPLVRDQARYVFRRLLAARGLIPHPPPVSERPRTRPRLPDAAARPAAPRPAVGRKAAAQGAALAGPLVAGLAALAFCAALLVVPPFRRRVLAALRPVADR